jgi:hypothetical protein
MPGLEIVTVSMAPTDDLSAALPDEVSWSADFVWLIR